MKQPPMKPDEEAQEPPEMEATEDEGSEEGEEKPNVSRREQLMYDVIMVQAHETMYSEQGVKSLVDKLASMKDKLPYAIGHTAAMMIRSVGGGLKKAGIPVEGDILLHAGTELVADITEIAVAAGMLPEAEAEAVGQQAVFEGLKIYGELDMKTGIDPKKQAAARAELDGAKQYSKVAAAMGAGLKPQGQAPAPQPGLVDAAKGV